MVSGRNFSRIDTSELKTRLCQKIGQQRAGKYFELLNRLFSLKLSKNEFDKHCVQAIGRENIPLHNLLFRSIIKNASLAKVPPLKVKRAAVGPTKVVNGCQRNFLQSLHCDAFPPSPRKARSPVNRDRKFWDRPSPLGPLGKSPSLTTYEDGVTKLQEQQSATELHSLGSRPPVEVASVEDGEEVEQFSGSPSIQSRSPVTAPLGISVNGGGGGGRKSLCFGSVCSSHPETCQSSGELPDSRTLKSRLEQKLEMEGFTASSDCINLLNNGLDAFLKRLIEPCIRLAGSRCQYAPEAVTHSNGMLPRRHNQGQSRFRHASMLDFRVAMESNPPSLGEDWAIQLEKICSRVMEE